MLKPFEVTTPKIATKAVTGEKIADNTIENRSFKAGTITPDKLTIIPVGRPLSPGLETSEIKDGAITSTKLAPNAVTTDHIAANAVATDDIKDNAITTAKIRDGAITREKVADRSVNTADLVDGAVTGIKIASNTITGAKIAANAVGSSEISAGAVGSSELANNSVTSDKIQNGAVVSDKMLDSSVITQKIANGAVTAEKLAPGVGGGDRFVFGTLATPGMQSADVLYLTDIAADIPYTVFDLSAWIPATAKAVILQLGMFNQAFTSGRAFFRVRTNTDQRDALGVGLIPGQNSMSANQGLVPITSSRTIEYALESVGGPWISTLTLYITVIGYIV